MKTTIGKAMSHSAFAEIIVGIKAFANALDECIAKAHTKKRKANLTNLHSSTGVSPSQHQPQKKITSKAHSDIEYDSSPCAKNLDALAYDLRKCAALMVYFH